MHYKKKIEYAEKVAVELQNNISKDKIVADLKANGLFEGDIAKVMTSAKNIIADNYREQIREHLKLDKEIQNSDEFSSVDKDILVSLIDNEKRKLGLEERKKITGMMKNGVSSEEILASVDYRFISADKVNEQLQKQEQVIHQNSGTGRMLNIGGGIGLIVLTGIIASSTGRLFYVLPIIGLGLIIKGFMTERMAYDD